MADDSSRERILGKEISNELMPCCSCGEGNGIVHRTFRNSLRSSQTESFECSLGFDTCVSLMTYCVAVARAEMNPTLGSYVRL